MDPILENTPEKLGKFNCDELEVHAEIPGKGSIMLFGTGGESGATGGLRFVFRRTSIPAEEKYTRNSILCAGYRHSTSRCAREGGGVKPW